MAIELLRSSLNQLGSLLQKKKLIEVDGALSVNYVRLDPLGRRYVSSQVSTVCLECSLKMKPFGLSRLQFVFKCEEDLEEYFIFRLEDG